MNVIGRSPGAAITCPWANAVADGSDRTSWGPYAALSLPGYRCLLSAGVLTAIGQTSQTVAVGWEMYERTRPLGDRYAAWMLGLTGLVQFFPILLLALPAGHFADRHSRKTIYQGSQLLSALASLGLAAFSFWGLPVETWSWLALGCLGMAGVARAFTAPSRSSLLPQIVPLELVPNAVAWNTTGWQTASISGPVLGGLLVWLAPHDPWIAYLVTACCTLACVLLLTPIRPRAQSLRLATPSMVSGLFEGIRFVLRTKAMLAAITLDLFAVLLGGAVALLPIFARDVLEVGPGGLGVMRSAPAFGALVTAIALAHLPPMRRPGVALLCAVAAFGAVTIVFGLSTNFFLSLAMLVLAGAADNVSVVVRHTLMQVLTPDEMRGRVAAVNTVFISSSNELGEFESGTTAAWWGPVRAVVVGGAGTIAVVLLVLGLWPGLLRLPPLHTLAKPTPPPDPDEGVRPSQDVRIVPASDLTGITPSDRGVQKSGSDV